MQTVEFSENINGKLFLNNFPELYLAEDKDQVFFIGEEYTVVLKQDGHLIKLGTAVVRAITPIRTIHVTDTLTFPSRAKDKHQVLDLFAKEAKAKKIAFDKETTVLNKVVFAYINKDIETHVRLHTEWLQIIPESPIQNYLE